MMADEGGFDFYSIFTMIIWGVKFSVHKIFTIYFLDAKAVLGNTTLKFFIQPELARAVWKTKGLYFLVRHEHPVSK